jgi:glycosyltransferase involved in cell wall biosynthesis
MRVGYFGTWERGYPRNEQVISALRKADVDVQLFHEELWSSTHNFATSPTIAPRLLAAEAKLALRRIPSQLDALIVGYPGQFDVWSAKRHGQPVIFNAMVSLFDTLVDDRGRFAPGTFMASAMRAVDRAALRAADVVVADTRANARYLAELANIGTPEVCYVGAEDRLFRATWRQPERFSVLFVGKLIPLHGVDVILESARALPDIPFRIIGNGQLDELLRDPPPNVEHIPWVEYNLLPDEYTRAGCALGVFGSSEKAQRVIPNKAFQALAVGTPLITASTPGAAELLQDGRDALLVEPTAESLARAIRRLADDPSLAEQIGRAGRHTYEENASESVLGQRWRAVIESSIRRAAR